MTIPIRIDGKGPWNFIIDTGSQRTVIAREHAHELALPSRSTVTILSMTGRSEAGTVAVPRLGFAGGTIEDIEAPVLEGEHLGASGLLGLDSLHARVTLNFRSKDAWKSATAAPADEVVADPDSIVVEAAAQGAADPARFRGERHEGRHHRRHRQSSQHRQSGPA